MKLTSTIISLAALFSVAYAQTQITLPVRPNSFYDNYYTSLNDVACSNGNNGLVTRGFTDFGSLPTFPNIGGVFQVGAWNSPDCGSCWELLYPVTGVSIYVTAIDTVYSGFDLSDQAVNTLTFGQAESPDFNFIDVEYKQVPAYMCGL